MVKPVNLRLLDTCANCKYRGPWGSYGHQTFNCTVEVGVKYWNGPTVAMGTVCDLWEASEDPGVRKWVKSTKTRCGIK